MILEDDKRDTPDPEAAAVSASVDAGTDFAFELSKSIVLSSPGRWYDVEAGCYIDEEPSLGLETEEQRGPAVSTPTHSHHHSPHHSPGPSNHQISQHDDGRDAQRALEELLHEDSRGESGEKVSQLEVDMLLAFEEQEKSSSAIALSSLCAHR